MRHAFDIGWESDGGGGMQRLLLICRIPFYSFFFFGLFSEILNDVTKCFLYFCIYYLHIIRFYYVHQHFFNKK